MKTYNKIIVLVLMAMIFSTIMSGCYDSREIDDQTYVVALGFDNGKLNPLRLTVQYAIPIALGGGGTPARAGSGDSNGGGKQTGTQTIGITVVETPSIYSGLNMINNYIGKQLNMSHAVVAVFSKELANSGKMFDYVHAMIRGREFRPNLNIAISRDTAEDYIRSVKPVQETNPAKYYELKFSTYKYTGLTANTQLSRFYSRQESLTAQSVATLVGVGNYDASSEIDPDISTYREKGRDKPMMGDYKAGDIPKSGEIKGETLGLAVFDGKIMVGELDGEETTLQLIASGEFDHAYLTFTDPLKKGAYVILNVRQNRSPSYKIDIKDKKPKIALNIKLEGDYLSIQSGIDYEVDNLRLFESYAENYIKKEMLRFLDRTTKEFQSDICGFGRYAKLKFLTWDAWEKYDWLSRYKNSTFDITVDLKVRRTGLMIRSIPPLSTKGVNK